MRWLRQALLVSAHSFGTLGRRLGPSLTAVVGFAGVVLVLLAVLSIRSGFRATLAATGSPDVAIVLHGGAGTEVNSILGRDALNVSAEAPGVARDAHGLLLAPQLLTQLNLIKRSSGTLAAVPFRGISPATLQLDHRLHIVRGRMFTPGLDQIIVGADAARDFHGLRLGSVLNVGANHWRVVGIFDDGGGLHNSELWTGLSVLQSAYERGDSFSSLYVQLRSPGAFAAFKRFLTSSPQLNVSVQRESTYFAAQAHNLAQFITIVGGLIAVLMGGGAVFGAINTMYTSVAARRREIATLRALGFARSAVLCSVLLEAAALAAAGGICGALLAHRLFNGFRATTYNQFSVVAFRFAVTTHLMRLSIGYAAVLGIIGGALPAIRAARQSIAAGLRPE